MANIYTLLIEKDGINKFRHTHNGLPLSKFMISNFECSIDGNLFKVVEKDGASRFSYLITNITVKDNTDSGTSETFTNPLVFENRLRALGYTPYFNFNDFGLTTDEYDAIHGADAPSAANPFATMANLGSTAINPYATFDFVKKGFGNAGIIPGAAGDVYQGWVSDGVYCPHAIYDGSGALDNPASFEIITTIEI